MPNQPRNYQLEAIDDTMKYIGRGINAGVVQLPTGTGKSLVQQELIKRHFPIEDKRSILIGGLSRSLNYQGLEGLRAQYPATAYAIERNNGLIPGSGIVMAQHDDYNARVVVASAQTVGPKTLQEKRKKILENMQIEKGDVTRSKNGGILLSPNSKRQYLITPRFDEILKYGKIDLWIHDECFAAGTLVDGRPIETLKVGDLVTAFNETTKQFEQKKIVRLFTHRPRGDIVKLEIGGTTIICTANHPFYTQRGWVAAGDLNAQDKLLSSELLSLRDGSCSVQTSGSRENRSLASSGQNVLFGGVYSKDCQRGIISSHGGNQPQICSGTDEEKQPHAYAGGSGQDAPNTSAYAMEASDSRRQRNGVHSATANFDVGLGGRLAYGTRSTNTETEAGGLSERLQNRYCAYGIHDRNRSGWGDTLPQAAHDSGSEENRFSEWVGVDGVTVLEQSSDGTYGGMLPDGLVYNFEVEDLHTYLANGVVVHNCHHAPADGTLWMVRQLNTIYEHLGEEPLRHVGFTATPFRADERALSNIYEILYFERDYAWAVENGYIVPLVDPYVLVDIMSEHGKSERLKVVENWMERVYEGYMDHCHGKRRCTCTFVGPINGMGAVEASRELHGYFNDRGIPTVHVDGEFWIDVNGTKRPNSERKHLWNALNSGAVPHIVNFGVMIEGIDVPIIDAIQIIRKMNAVTFTQAAGRAARLFPGKENALVIDYTGQELVQMMMGLLSGVKVDPFKQLIETPKAGDGENEGDTNERTGRSMRDQSPEGYVQGVNNIYKEAKIKRHSDMVWFKDFPGSINWSMSVTRSDKDAGTRSSSFLITLPQHTESNYYASVAAELPEGKLRDTAQTLADILRNFTLWHTMEGDAWETLPNGHRYRPHIVVRNSDNEVYQKSMPEFDRLEEATSRYAKTVPGYDKSIAAKGADWRRKDYPMSAPQERFFVGLMPTLDPNQYNKSHGASMITHMLAESAVYRILNNAKKAVKDATR